MERMLPDVYERIITEYGHDKRLTFLLAGSLRRIPINPGYMRGIPGGIIEHFFEKHPDLAIYLTLLTPEQYGEERDMNRVVENTMWELLSPFDYGGPHSPLGLVIAEPYATELLKYRTQFPDEPEGLTHDLIQFYEVGHHTIRQCITEGRHGFLPNTPEGYNTFHMLGYEGEPGRFLPSMVESVATDYVEFLQQHGGGVGSSFQDDLYAELMFHMEAAEIAYAYTDKPVRDSNEAVSYHAARAARYMMDALLYFGELPKDPAEFVKGYIAAVEHDSWEDLRPIEPDEDDDLETRAKKLRVGKNTAAITLGEMQIVGPDGQLLHTVPLPGDLDKILGDLAAQNEQTYLQNLLSRRASFWARKVKAYGDRPDNFFTYPAKKPLIAMLRKAVETCFTAGPIGLLQDDEPLYDTVNNHINKKTLVERCYMTIFSQLAFLHALTEVRNNYVMRMTERGYNMMTGETVEDIENARAQGFLTAEDIMAELSMDRLVQNFRTRRDAEGGMARFSLTDIMPHTSRAADILVYGKRKTVRGPGISIPMWLPGSRAEFKRKRNVFDTTMGLIGKTVRRVRKIK